MCRDIPAALRLEVSLSPSKAKSSRPDRSKEEKRLPTCQTNCQRLTNTAKVWQEDSQDGPPIETEPLFLCEYSSYCC